MAKIIFSQRLRTKRMPIRYFIWICPLIYGLVFSLYFLTSNTFSGKEISVYFLVYAILSGFAMSIFMPMLYEADSRASFFVNDISVGINRRRLFISKFILSAILIGLIEIIVSLIIIGFSLLFRKNVFDINKILIFMTITYITLLPQIVLYQFLALKYGYAGSILIGTFITLSSLILGTTDLGYNVWYVLPFTWDIKLVIDYGKGIMDKNEILIYLFLSIIILSMLLSIISLWYNKWEAISKVEE